MKPWWWLVAALVVVVAWLVGEILAQAWLEQRIADRVAEAAAGQVAVEADIESFPVATGVMVTGAVDRVEVGLTQVAGRGLGPIDLRISVTGLRLDRSALLSGDLDVTGLDEGQFRAARSTTGLPRPVVRGLELALDGAERLGVDVTESGLRIELPLIGGVELSLPLTAPCDPGLSLEGQDLVFACTFTKLPDVLTAMARPGVRVPITAQAQPVTSASNASSPPS